MKALETLVAELFRKHWQAVSTDLNQGVDVAKERLECFFAGSERERRQRAYRYYDPTRAAKLATASDNEVHRLSRAWLDAFRRYTEYQEIDGWEVRNRLSQLVSAEYIAVSWLSPDPFGRPRDEVTNVSPLPNVSVLYGDVYEITASGFSCGAQLRICKSVAEPIGPRERIGMMKGIRQEFLDNADEAGETKGEWQIRFRKPKDRRLIEAIVKPKDSAKHLRHTKRLKRLTGSLVQG